MSNPWLKKNPFMSMWLSAANSMIGQSRAQATAQARRQVSTAVADATRESLKLWSGSPTPTISKKAKPKRKR